ncbi:MAG: hypothetical protein ACI4KI_04145 [Candidatus Fimenecus sp.]
MANRYALTERQKVMDTYLKGCVNLYGFVTIRQFLKVFNRYNQPKLLKEEFMKCADKLVRNSYMNYQIYSNAIINKQVDEEKIGEIVSYQSGKKYYMPQEAEILSYANAHYFEQTPQTNELARFLTMDMQVNMLVTNAFMEKLLWYIRIEEPPRAQYSLIDKFHVNPENMAQANELIQRMTEVHNNTRKWANCGYTPHELFYAKHTN